MYFGPVTRRLESYNQLRKCSSCKRVILLEFIRNRDFWQYYEPIRLNMPKNCSADVGRVVDYIDSLIAAGNQTGISQIQSTLDLVKAGPVSNFMTWSMCISYI